MSSSLSVRTIKRHHHHLSAKQQEARGLQRQAQACRKRADIADPDHEEGGANSTQKGTRMRNKCRSKMTSGKHGGRGRRVSVSQKGQGAGLQASELVQGQQAAQHLSRVLPKSLLQAWPPKDEVSVETASGAAFGIRAVHFVFVFFSGGVRSVESVESERCNFHSV